MGARQSKDKARELKGWRVRRRVSTSLNTLYLESSRLGQRTQTPSTSLAQLFGLVRIGAAAQLLGLVVDWFIKPIAYKPSARERSGATRDKHHGAATTTRNGLFQLFEATVLHLCRRNFFRYEAVAQGAHGQPVHPA